MEWTGLAAVIFIMLEQIGIYREKIYCAILRRLTEFPGHYCCKKVGAV